MCSFPKSQRVLYTAFGKMVQIIRQLQQCLFKLQWKLGRRQKTDRHIRTEMKRNQVEWLTERDGGKWEKQVTKLEGREKRCV